MGRRGFEPPEAEANGFTDRTATNYGVTYPKAPYTGFEPASPHGPTVFKTAPSPPGHTANYENVAAGIRTQIIRFTI